MTLYSELERRGLLDLPNEDSANIIKTVTNSDMVVSEAKTWMREELLWYWKDPTSMGGAIQDALDGGSLPADLVTALGELWSSLFGQSATILRTNEDIEVAQRIFDGKTALQAVGVMTQDQVDGFYDLGGGLSFPGTTAADVQAAKDQKAAADAAAAAEEARLESEMALRQKWDAALAGANVDEAFYNGDEVALIAAINAAVATMG